MSASVVRYTDSCLHGSLLEQFYTLGIIFFLILYMSCTFDSENWRYCNYNGSPPPTQLIYTHVPRERPPLWSEFLATGAEVPGLIPNPTRFSGTGSTQPREDI
jgi:hypothetical protein